MQFIGRPGGSLVALAGLAMVIETWQGIRAEGTVLEHPPRYQELRSVNVSRVPEQFVRGRGWGRGGMAGGWGDDSVTRRSAKGEVASDFSAILAARASSSLIGALDAVPRVLDSRRGISRSAPSSPRHFEKRNSSLC
jgi:hypothetical protein